MKIRANKRDKKIAVAVMALSAFAAFQPSWAVADDTAAEIRLLKGRLKQLEERVAEQGRKEKQTQEKLRQAAAQAGPGPAPGPASYYGPGPGPGPGPGAYYFGVGLPPQPGPGGLTATETAVRGLPTIGPSSIWFKGISITPGGFLALESVTRSAFLGADIGSPPFSNIPFSNVPSSHSGEFRFTARQSRASLLMQGDVDPATHLAGYGEMDFLGAAQTANSNESNSYNLRMRHLYLTVDNDYFGAHLLAGQEWSLATMDTKGILPRQEDIPLTIDAQYVPGFVWQRTPQIRIVKDFDKTLWFALSAENPATTTGGTAPSSLVDNGVIVTGVSAANPAPAFPQTGVLGGSLFNNSNAINLTQMPDIIGKVAWEPTIADRTIHMEAFGIFRQFTDRIVYPFSTVPPFGAGLQNHNNQTTGEGVGGSILIPVLPKLVEVQFSGLTGRGIGRYGTSQLPDVTFNADGSLAPLQETMLLAGAVWHAFPELDFYGYAGEEFQGSHFGFSIPGAHAGLGWGNPAFVNTGCNIEFTTSTSLAAIAGGTTPAAVACAGNTSLVRQATVGFWDNIYKGPFGRLAGGLQYSFTQKYGFNGIGTPERNENTFLTSLRYYPF
jgi:hypothetical protein